MILIPWRATAGRERLLHRVIEHLSPLGLEIVTADSDSHPFSIAQAFNNAADRDWEHAVLTEADVLAPLDNIREGLETAGLVFCYDSHQRLSPAETDRYLTDGMLPKRRPKRYGSNMGWNGVRTIDRATWDRVGGYDPAFVGWGGEDNDFYWRVLVGGPISRLAGVQVELAHPRDRDYQNGVTQNRLLLARKHPSLYP